MSQTQTTSHAGGNPDALVASIAGSPPNQLALWRGRDRWVRRWQVPSTTDETATYTVAVDAAGNFGCSCRGWIYTVPRTDCKHIRQLQMTQAQEQAS